MGSRRIKRSRKKHTKKKVRRTKNGRRTKKKSRRRTKKRSRKRKHKFLKKFDDDYLDEFESPHDMYREGSRDISDYNPNHIKQLGDCSLCTLKLLNVLPPNIMKQAYREMQERLDTDVYGSEDARPDDVITYLINALRGSDDNNYYNIRLAYSPILSETTYDNQGNKNRVVFDENIKQTISMLISNLEPGYMSIVWIDYGDNSKGQYQHHLLSLGMTERGELVLLEPQDFFGTSGKKLIRYEGNDKVYQYLSKLVKQVAIIVSDYVDTNVTRDPGIYDIYDPDDITDKMDTDQDDKVYFRDELYLTKRVILEYLSDEDKYSLMLQTRGEDEALSQIRSRKILDEIIKMISNTELTLLLETFNENGIGIINKLNDQYRYTGIINYSPSQLQNILYILKTNASTLNNLNF